MKLYKFILVFLVLCILAPGTSFAVDNYSKLEQKYQREYPDLFKKYLEVKSLMDMPGRNLGNLEKANLLLNEILEENLNFAPAYFEYARLTFKSGFREGQIHSGSLYAQPRYRQGTAERAETAVKQALSLEPSYADAYLALAYINILREQFNQAEDALRTADAFGSKSPWLYLYYASMLDSKRKYPASRLLYKLVLDQEFEDKSARHYALIRLAVNYSYSGDSETADSWYQKAIKFEPTVSVLNTYVSFLIFQRMDFEKAAEFGDISLSRIPTERGKYLTGLAYYARWADGVEKSGDAAPALLDRAMELLPEMLTAMGAFSNHPNTRYLSQPFHRKFMKMDRNYKMQKQS